MSRTGDFVLKKFFQYGTQGDSEIIGTLEVEEEFDKFFELYLRLLSRHQVAYSKPGL